MNTAVLSCSALLVADSNCLDLTPGSAWALKMHEARLEGMGDLISPMSLKLCLFPDRNQENSLYGEVSSNQTLGTAGVVGSQQSQSSKRHFWARKEVTRRNTKTCIF